MKQHHLYQLLCENSRALRRIATLLDTLAVAVDGGLFAADPAEPAAPSLVPEDFTTKRMSIPEHLLAKAAEPLDPVTRKMGSVPPGVPSAGVKRAKGRGKRRRK